VVTRVITQDTQYISHVTCHARSPAAAAAAPGALGQPRSNPLYQEGNAPGITANQKRLEHRVVARGRGYAGLISFFVEMADLGYLLAAIRCYHNTLLKRAYQAHKQTISSTRSIGFCTIWVCISPSSSSLWQCFFKARSEPFLVFFVVMAMLNIFRRCAILAY